MTEAHRMMKKSQEFFASMSDVEEIKCAVLGISIKLDMGLDKEDFHFESDVVTGKQHAAFYFRLSLHFSKITSSMTRPLFRVIDRLICQF